MKFEDFLTPDEDSLLFQEKMKEIMQRHSQLRAALTEELILNFLVTGKNEYQLVEQRFPDKTVIRLEKINKIEAE